MRLGASSFGDYEAERLGLGLRSAQEMARTAGQLEELCARPRMPASSRPATCACWPASSARATRPTGARGLTVRGLREAIKAAKEASSAAGDGRPDEPEGVRVAFDAPSRFKAKWLAAVELFRKLAGAELSEASAAEAFAAEWRSGAPLPPHAAGSAGARPGRSSSPEPCRPIRGCDEGSLTLAGARTGVSALGPAPAGVGPVRFSFAR